MPSTGIPERFYGRHPTCLGRESEVPKPYRQVCILLMSPYVGLLSLIYLSFFYFSYLVNDDLYLLKTWLPVHGLLLMVDCVWLCCLTYVIVWMSRVKASFKYWSILITNVGKLASFSPCLFFMYLCCCICDFSFRYISKTFNIIYECVTVNFVNINI